MRCVKVGGVVQYLGLDEMPPDQLELVMAARQATNQSHSPYSNFRVGAALRLANGEIVTGANQENAAFPLCTCAERSAIVAACNGGHQKNIRAIAVTGRIGGVAEEVYRGIKPITACGACRQIMKEFEDLGGEPMVILMDGYSDEVARVVGIETLLPLGFGPKDFLKT
jgi:cytidine deaminase